MSELQTHRTEHHITFRNGGIHVIGPLTDYAPQIVSIYDSSDGAAYIPASDIDLLIEALTAVRDAMKEGRP